MAITAKNQRLIAYKKLLGKTHTNAQFGTSNEQYASAVQLGTKEIFANTPSLDPLKYCEQFTFDLEPINLSSYDVDNEDIAEGNAETGTNPAEVHAWRIKFPADTFLNGVQVGGQALTDDIKKQIVPTKYGAGFLPLVQAQNGDLMAQDALQDWVFDYYAGILFMQDTGPQVPTTLTAYCYTGEYVSDLLVEKESVLNPQNDVVRAVVDEMNVGNLVEPASQGQPGYFGNLTTPPLVKIGGNAGITGDLEIEGTLHTKQLIVEETTQVVEKVEYSGEAIFGNEDSLLDESYKDNFKFYGDIEVFGNLSVTGDTPSKKKVATLKRKDINLETFFISDTTRIIDADSNVEGRSGVVELKKSSVFLIEDPSDSSVYNANDEILVNITLPDLVDVNAEVIPGMNNVEYVFKRLTDNNVTYSVKINSYDETESTIDGESSILLNVKYETITILSNNGNWHIL
jgi:hypothetical protein